MCHLSKGASQPLNGSLQAGQEFEILKRTRGDHAAAANQPVHDALPIEKHR